MHIASEDLEDLSARMLYNLGYIHDPKLRGTPLFEKMHELAGDNYGCTVSIYTDGACLGNPGPGGWGVIMFRGEPDDIDHVDTKKLRGGSTETTNNEMELTAVLAAMDYMRENATRFPQPLRILLNSDSKYITNAINEGWLTNWQKNGWKTKKKEPVKNAELWRRIAEHLENGLDVRFEWVRGHSGDKANDIADRIASEQASQFSLATGA